MSKTKTSPRAQQKRLSFIVQREQETIDLKIVTETLNDMAQALGIAAIPDTDLRYTMGKPLSRAIHSRIYSEAIADTLQSDATIWNIFVETFARFMVEEFTPTQKAEATKALSALTIYLKLFQNYPGTQSFISLPRSHLVLDNSSLYAVLIKAATERAEKIQGDIANIPTQIEQLNKSIEAIRKIPHPENRTLLEAYVKNQKELETLTANKKSLNDRLNKYGSIKFNDNVNTLKGLIQISKGQFNFSETQDAISFLLAPIGKSSYTVPFNYTAPGVLIPLNKPIIIQASLDEKGKPVTSQVSIVDMVIQALNDSVLTDTNTTRAMAMEKLQALNQFLEPCNDKERDKIYKEIIDISRVNNPIMLSPEAINAWEVTISANLSTFTGRKSPTSPDMNIKSPILSPGLLKRISSLDPRGSVPSPLTLNQPPISGNDPAKDPIFIR